MHDGMGAYYHTHAQPSMVAKPLISLAAEARCPQPGGWGRVTSAGRAKEARKGTEVSSDSYLGILAQGALFPFTWLE